MEIRKPEEINAPRYYGVWNGKVWINNMDGEVIASLSPALLLACSSFDEDRQVAEIPPDGGPPTVTIDSSASVTRAKEWHRQFAEQWESEKAEKEATAKQVPTPKPDPPKTIEYTRGNFQPDPPRPTGSGIIGRAGIEPTGSVKTFMRPEDMTSADKILWGIFRVFEVTTVVLLVVVAVALVMGWRR